MTESENGSPGSEAMDRRSFLTRSGSAALGAGVGGQSAPSRSRPKAVPPPSKPSSPKSPPPSTFLNIHRLPDSIIVDTEAGVRTLTTGAAGAWQGAGVEVTTDPRNDGLHVSLTAPETAVKRLALRWHGSMAGVRQFLGDHWERGYGDLEWRGCVPERAMPWYVLTFDGGSTHGYGVKTGANALCFWQADGDGLTLWTDVRSGGSAVRLGGRTLDVCTVVSREGAPHEGAWHAHHLFCRAMCPSPRLPAQPVYGSNDWYYAYGNNTASQILYDCDKLVLMCTNGATRPYAVVDAGWQPGGGAGGGPWDRGNDRFPSMADLALRISEHGARPGIWIRPLAGGDSRVPASWRLARDKQLLDPTVPEVLGQVTADIARLRTWGYELIKHDFSSVDILGKWGFEMGAEPARNGWQFSRRDKTSAEIILELYRTIRQAAGNAVIIGCNTISHLSAGIFELCRIGDDTSGQNWERTRKMGVNSLAFRGAQHNAFYAVDADCVGLTTRVPWAQNRQWLDLLARSGTPMFLSIQQDAMGPEQLKAVREALALASERRPTAEPLDWMTTTCPRSWRIDGKTHDYDWYLPAGASPFPV